MTRVETTLTGVASAMQWAQSRSTIGDNFSTKRSSSEHISLQSSTQVMQQHTMNNSSISKLLVRRMKMVVCRIIRLWCRGRLISIKSSEQVLRIQSLIKTQSICQRSPTTKSNLATTMALVTPTPTTTFTSKTYTLRSTWRRNNRLSRQCDRP